MAFCTKRKGRRVRHTNQAPVTKKKQASTQTVARFSGSNLTYKEDDEKDYIQFVCENVETLGIPPIVTECSVAVGSDLTAEIKKAVDRAENQMMPDDYEPEDFSSQGYNDEFGDTEKVRIDVL